MPGTEVPPDPGYPWATEVGLGPEDLDAQGHLNHIAAFGLLMQLRMDYLAVVLGPGWRTDAVAGPVTWAVGEVHVRYAAQGWPGAAYRGRARVAHRSGRALVVESQLLSGPGERLVAHAYAVQLILRDSTPIPWPQASLDRVEQFQGRSLPDLTGRPRAPFGPLSSYPAGT